MKPTLIFLAVLGSLIFLTSLLTRGDNSTQAASRSATPAPTIVDGKQIIDITAKGGYRPRMTNAKANIATLLKVTTKGTFDCSASLVIPALNYEGLLEPSGVTEIPVPPQQAGTTIRGLCAMGMYSFQIKFS